MSIPTSPQPGRKRSAVDSQSEPTASRETRRATDSVPMQSGTFSSLPMRFGRYQVDKLLGRGQMGAVYLACDVQLDRLVALKIPKVSASGSKKLLKRLETEARAAARIDHPHVCKVFDFGEIDGVCFIAMQFVEGQTLKTHLQTHPRSPAEAVVLILQLAYGLSEAHAAHVVHRDLKPENIMINQRGIPVIMDFGLAKLSNFSGAAGATQAGTVLGTPAYMSPEQARGNITEIDERSDLYALGVIFFEVLTGQWPFTGSGIEIMGRKSVLEAPSPLSIKPDLPPQLVAICHRMIARKSSDRYQNLEEVIADLRQLDLATESTDAGAIVPESSIRRAADSLELLRDFSTEFSRSLPQYASAWWGRQHPALHWTALAGAALIGLYLSAVLLFSTANGVVQIEIDDPTLAVRFDGATITIESDGKPISVKATVAHTLEVLRDDVTIDSSTRELTLNKGEKRLIKVSLLDGEVAIDGKKVANETKHVATQVRIAQERTVSEVTAPIDVAPSRLTDLAAATKSGEEWSSNGLQAIFCWCPPGQFTMGSPKKTQVRPDENQAEVTLTSGFWIGKYEVTQQEWANVMETQPWHGQMNVKEGARYPATYITREMAGDFCDKFTNAEHGAQRLPPDWEYALPTEAQWEFACRAGTVTRFSFGARIDLLPRHAWFNQNTAGEQFAHEVGLKMPNTLGLFDIHGNVAEWCRDKRVDKLPGGIDPEVDLDSSYRVFRGGCWAHSGVECGSAVRYGTLPGYSSSIAGFRVIAMKIKKPVPNVQTNSPHTELTASLADSQAALTFAGTRVGEEWSTNGVKMKFCWCPPGAFSMGSPKSEPERERLHRNESQVVVKLTKGFWLGKYEVTQGEWQQLMRTTVADQGVKSDKNYGLYGMGDAFPMYYINYDEACEFCDQLTKLDVSEGRLPAGWAYRLPTEAQWEYACRAGVPFATSFGERLSSRDANFNGYGYNGAANGPAIGATVRVGSYGPNRLGLCDMHGNVYEWCRDWYEQRLPGGDDAEVTVRTSTRVLRGGSWYDDGSYCRSAFRHHDPGENRHHNVGFRVAVVSLSK